MPVKTFYRPSGHKRKPTQPYSPPAVLWCVAWQTLDDHRASRLLTAIIMTVTEILFGRLAIVYVSVTVVVIFAGF